FAELLLLANTQAMLHMRPSPAADFIRARALARNPSFRMLPPVCHTSPIPPIPRQLFAKFFVVEPSLNLAYCGLPKVACTSWRMWLRAMLHLPKPEDHFLAHSYEGSGLGDLSQKFTEKEATRAMTRRGLFKFTFVRNPFSRVVSTYLNKLVVTDAPDRTKGWGTREFWNKELFGTIQPFLDLLKDPATQLVSFHDFMRLVEHLIRGQKPLDRHITPQVDLCSLDQIQYDYVGHFENLEDGVRVVTARYNHSNIHLFEFGKEAHATGTDLKLARLYDAETVRRVSK
ncbi:unnamed protein product, partial [Closterium sp. NIES-53]